MSNPHETLWKQLTYELTIFTKFHEDRTKIVDFLLMANFWVCLVFSYSDLTYRRKKCPLSSASFHPYYLVLENYSTELGHVKNKQTRQIFCYLHFCHWLPSTVKSHISTCLFQSPSYRVYTSPSYPVRKPDPPRREENMI